MATMEALERRIHSAEDLQSVVHTMKILAAVSIRQYESAVEALGDYTRTLALGFRMLRWLHPHDMPREPHTQTGKLGCIVFGSDQGMCGSFNEQIGTFVEDITQAMQPDRDRQSYLVVGGRVAGSLEDRALPIQRVFEVPGSVGGITPLVLELLPAVQTWQVEQELDQVYVFHNTRQTETSYHPIHVQLWPLEPEHLLRPHTTRWSSRSLPMITMNPGELYSMLIRQHLFVSLFRACAHSLAGENASRIASMQAAERNINQRLDVLRDEWRRTRQTLITEELLDVITGFEALRKD
jgi:F-type H+-transporting ATPase subunit gamma